MPKENIKTNKIVQHYKGFEITVERDVSLGGEDLLYYSIFRDEDGWNMESSFTSGSEDLLSMSNYLREHVEDYLKNPGDYK